MDVNHDILPEIDLNNPQAVAELLHQTAELNRNDPRRTACVVDLPAQGTLLATGDLHDNTPALQRIAKLAKLDQSPEHHLVLHEIIHSPNHLNGIDLSIRTLARACALKRAYPDQVCFLLSNHELAQRRQEHVFKQSGSDVDAFNAGLKHLYGNEAGQVQAAFEAYVDSLPLAVRCANGIMVAHSLPAPRNIEAFDPSVLDRGLGDADYQASGSANLMVWGRYQNQKIAQELADAWGVSAFILGHQQAEMGYEKLAHNSLILASDHSQGCCLPIDLSQRYQRDDLIDRVVPISGIQL